MTSVLGRRRLKGRLILYVRLQYIPEVKGNFLNVRVGLNNGHLTKSLRNYFVNVRSPAEVAIPWLHLEVRNAA